jgi:hypothetical protein
LLVTKTALAFFFLGFATLAEVSSLAQSPIGAEFQVNAEAGIDLRSYIATGQDGEFAVTWLHSDDPSHGTQSILLRRISPSGKVSEPLTLVNSSIPANTLSSPQVVLTSSGSTLLYTQNRPDGSSRIFGHRFTKAGFASGPRLIVSKPLPSDSSLHAFVPLPKGGYFVLTEDDLCPSCQDPRHHLFARVLNPKGQHSSSYFQVDEDSRRASFCGVKSLSGASDGTAVTVWGAENGANLFDPQQTAILGQRFSSTGERLGDTFLVNDLGAGQQTSPSVAASSAGDFVVVWQFQPDESTPRSIRGKRFSRVGRPIEPMFVVGDENADSLNPSIASDAQGNFVVVWTDIELPFCPFVKGRLYRNDGRPVGPSFFLTASTDYCDEAPQVAFGPQGVLAATWQRDLDSGGFDVYAARFLASPGDEPCLVRGGQVLCFTPTSGGEPVLTQAFGGRPGEITLIGDFDGDGRADLCTRFGTTFACDLRRYGTLSDGTAVSFGLDGDIPLLGDIDGDGKADLCVYRGSQFLCDTTRQGGIPNVTISFGLPTDIPLLGDIDGDGKADPCVYRAGVFLCDTTHQGAVPNVTIPFGQPGDQPALGDIDGDGKADPCVLHAGHLLCDTTHRGGKPNVDLNLHARPGDRLIIGNLDGL